MDPKQNSNQPLDPKLQEAYDRVMGTNPAGVDPTAAAPTDTANPVPPTMPTQPPVPAEPPMPAEPPTPVVPPAPVTPAEPTMPVEPPPMPPMPPLGDQSTSLPPVPPVTPTEPPVNPPSQPAIPSMPEAPVPTTPTTDDASTAPTMPSGEQSSNPPTDTMQATMPNVISHQETIKIGMGGSPVGVTTKTKKKGVSPLILIFGAFAFLVVYAVFWVKFFGYSLPFLSK